jgi:TetR/AcrR family transcriptional regulator, repressor of fatR-cypB operon
MNEYSLKYMARTIDNTKIEGVKQNAIKLIVENGYGGASISNIAKKAKVAEGYLYRFYKSKEELVLDLLNSKIEEIADNIEESIMKSESVHQIIDLLVKSIFKIATKSSDDIKFLYVMMNDYSFSMTNKIRERIRNLCIEVKEKGLNLGELDIQTSEEEIYMIMVIYPIQFINLRLKSIFGISKWTSEDIERLINICSKSLKK